MIEFKIDDKEYVIKKPTAQQKRESNQVYNREYRDSLRSGAFLRAQINKMAVEQEIWSDEENQKYLQLQKQIKYNEDSLKRGGIPLEMAKKLAVELKSLRMDLISVIGKLNALDSQSVESQADNAKQNFLVSQCLYEKGSDTPYCKDYDWFLENGEDDAVVISAVINWSLHLNNINKDFFDSLPENKFLRDYGFEEEDSEDLEVQETVEEFQPFTTDGEPVQPLSEEPPPKPKRKRKVKDTEDG